MCLGGKMISEDGTREIGNVRHRRRDLFNFYCFLCNTFFRRTLRHKINKRVVLKNGDCNISQSNLTKKRRRYLADIFTTLVDIQWGYNVIIFTMGFVLSWLGFSVIWWYTALLHGDFDHLDDPEWQTCLVNVDSFISAFLFSVETQQTIGYGWRRVTTSCPVAIALVCVQCIAGVIIQAFLAGVVFAKLSRSKSRSRTLLFSRNAVVSMRDSKLCLMFRIADMRKSHMIVAQIRAQLIKKRTTLEDESLSNHIYDVTVSVDTCDDHLFFIWPCVVVHVIDEKSPFYSMSASGFLREEFEIVVSLEGVIESTGITTQARSSYLPTEILWGHRFKQLVNYNKETEDYRVDFSRFNDTYQVRTPLCSAKELGELHNSCDNFLEGQNSNNLMISYTSFEDVKSNDSVRVNRKSKVSTGNAKTSFFTFCSTNC